MNNSKMTNDQQGVDTLHSDYVAEFLQSPRGKFCRKRLGKVCTIGLLELVFTCVGAEVDSLNPLVMHKAKDLCNREIWQHLKGWELTCGGICIASLAETGALPLRRHRTPSGKGPASYWIL
jgi:hypothetical protein